MQKWYNLKRIIKEYQIKKNKPIYFDFKKASESLLREKFEKDNRNIHYIHYYPGRIYPYIPLFILSLSDFADLNGYVLDPFSGSGTILLESIINPVLKRNAFGIEINPIARLISKVKTNPIDTKKINKLIDKIHIIYSKKTNKSYFIPEYKNINLWFSKDAINKLSNLKYAIEKLNESNDYMNFFWVCFSNIVRKASRADPNIPPPVILKDYYFKSLHQKIEPFAMILGAEQAFQWVFVKTTGESMSEVIQFAKQEWQRINPGHPFEYTFVDKNITLMYQSEMKLSRLFSIFTIIAIYIACLGLFGLTSFSVLQRTKEIGIRKVVGASTGSILIILLKEYIKWVIVANIIAWPLAYYFMHRWLEGFAYHINLNILIFLSSGITALIIALLTISFQTYKAASANPIDSLRYE